MHDQLEQESLGDPEGLRPPPAETTSRYGMVRARVTLVMPLVGALDSARLAQVEEQALERLEASRARRLLLDITGVPSVDAQVAQGLVRVVQAARLLGARATLVGIRPEVAQSIVNLGLDLSHIHTESDLQSALALQ